MNIFNPDNNLTWTAISAIADVVSAIMTIAGFVWILMLYRKSINEEKHRYWNQNIPVVNIASPCSPFLSACDIDITKDREPVYMDGKIVEYIPMLNGATLFSLVNTSKNCAYNISLFFYEDSNFDRKIRSSFYNEVYPTSLSEYGNITSIQYVYSKFQIDPDTKEVNYSEFDICGSLSNCELDSKNSRHKNLYAKIEYYSSPDTRFSTKIVSKFKIKLSCGCNEKGESIRDKVEMQNINSKQEVKILSIVRLSYELMS